jgi:hypothetical protein
VGGHLPRVTFTWVPEAWRAESKAGPSAYDRWSQVSTSSERKNYAASEIDGGAFIAARKVAIAPTGMAGA